MNRHLTDLRATARLWLQLRAATLAAELTLFALLSALPLLLVAAAGLGALDEILGASTARDVETFLLRHVASVTGDQGVIVGAVSRLFAQADGRVLTIGILATIYAAARVLVAFITGLEMIFTPVDQRRGWFGKRGTALVLAGTSIAALALTVTVAAAGDRAVSALFGNKAVGDIAAALVVLVSYGLALVYVAWLYSAAPRVSLPLRHQLPGAAFAVTLAYTSGRAIRWWFATMETNAVFGSIGAALALFWWTYVVACGLVLGAVWNVARFENRRADTPVTHAPSRKRR